MRQGRFYAPADAWISGDDCFDRKQRRFEAHYSMRTATSRWMCPPGLYRSMCCMDFERRFERREVTIVTPGATAEVSVNLGEGNGRCRTRGAG